MFWSDTGNAFGGRRLGKKMGETSFCLRPNKNKLLPLHPVLHWIVQWNIQTVPCCRIYAVLCSFHLPAPGEKSKGCLQLSCRSPEPSPWGCVSGLVPPSARCAGTASPWALRAAVTCAHSKCLGVTLGASGDLPQSSCKPSCFCFDHLIGHVFALAIHQHLPFLLVVFSE